MRRTLTGTLLVLTACTAAGPAAGPVADAPAGPVLATGSISRAGQEEARSLFDAALEARDRGRLQEADELASRVIEGYPSSAVSVDALDLRAELRSAAGLEALSGEEPEVPAQEMLAAARSDLERLLAVLPPQDARRSGVRSSLVPVLAGLGETTVALELLLEQASRAGAAADPSESPRREGVTVDTGFDPGQIRELVAATPLEDLRRLAEGDVPPGPAGQVFLVAYARTLRLAGDDGGARITAREALAAGVSGADSAVAAALAEGRGLPRSSDAPVPVGVILPLGGSPAFQSFSRQLQEGIETAVDAWGLEDDVELLVLDDGGDIRTAANLVRTAETRGAVAILGMLEDATLAAAAGARVEVPLISPTAYEVPGGTREVFSLNAFDPGAAEALALWAAGSGLKRVAVIHAATGSSADEARVFQEVFEDLGGEVISALPYPAGITFWESQLLEIRGQRPQALVLPVPPEDIPGIAPQVTFFGLDTMGIRVLGTGGWTDPQILREVDTRHTNGVVVATPVRPSPGDPGYDRFQSAYETRFQRGLVDAAVPALGYDAASLVLQGVYGGAGGLSEIQRSLNGVQGFQGATGTLSVVDGVVTREHQVVCLSERAGVPVLVGDLPAQRYRAYQMESDTIPPPPGPGRPDGFDCGRFQLPPLLDSRGLPVVDEFGFPVLDSLWLQRRDSAAGGVTPDSSGILTLPDTADGRTRPDTAQTVRSGSFGTTSASGSRSTLELLDRLLQG